MRSPAFAACRCPGRTRQLTARAGGLVRAVGMCFSSVRKGASMQTYDFAPRFPDRSSWTLPAALRRQAEACAGKVFIRVPAENFDATYEQCVAQAESVASGLHAVGARVGDRVLLIAGNNSAHLQAWFGCSFGGYIDVPLNTAYQGADRKSVV